MSAGDDLPMRALVLGCAVLTAGCGLISGLDNLVVASDASAEAGDASEASAPDSTSDALAACPLEQGNYTLQYSGADCPADTPPPECVQQSGCTITIKVAGPAAKASLSGATSIASDGSFSNAAITVGNAPRTGCTGVFTAGATTTLVIDCGGAQSCVATLTRTNNLVCK